MAEINNAHCSICGKPYQLCNSCGNEKVLKPWRSVTDCIEHYKIYLAIHGYSLSKNKASAKKELENCDLTGLEDFNPSIKTVIAEIMAEPKKIKYVSKKTVVKTDIEAGLNDIDE